MELLSVTLKNFKSHSDRHFAFQLGTNAICGENGAGKTSILEAIAWVLFDYKGDYKIEDLIRNGANSAQARISFVSNRDHRTYEIQRCTRSGYTIFDPQLGEKLGYTRIKEEVLPWLREHLGVAPGTDLAKLFSNTIGVPQGTFTADFLQTAEKRKPIFDAILKVEEYRQVNQQMLSLEKYAKAESDRLQREIEQYDESLQEWDELVQKQSGLKQTINRIQTELQHWQHRFDELQIEQDKYSAIAAQVQQLTTQLEATTARIQSETISIGRAQAELAMAENSVAICTERRDSYQAYLGAEQALEALNQSRTRQDALLRQRQNSIEETGGYQAKLAAINSQIERRSQIQIELKYLEPLVNQQVELEQHQQQLNDQLQSFQSWKQTLDRDTKRFDQLQQRHKELSEEIERLEALGTIVKQIPQLEQQQQRYQQQLSRIAAATQFETDLRQILSQAQQRETIHQAQVEAATATLKELSSAAPLWQAQLDRISGTIDHGATLNRQLMLDLQGILDDLSEQLLIDRLTELLNSAESQLQSARDKQAQYLTLEIKFDQEEKLDAEIEELRSILAQHQSQLSAEPELKQQLESIKNQLKTLDKPRERSQILKQDLQKTENLDVEQQKIQRALKSVQDAIAEVDAELKPFETLPDQMREQQMLRDRHRENYQTYLEHQQSANSYAKRKTQLEEAQAQLKQLETQIVQLTDQKSQLDQIYNAEHVSAIDAAYKEANDKKVSLSSTLPLEMKNLEECEIRLSRLRLVQEKRNESQTQLKQKQKTERFIKFARKAYKEAAPRITERYVQNISREADRLFRELLNRPNVALEWTRDYEIIVQEGAHSRRFVNLSGGEQMCAALAVRLALLKVLADINIAFFDEPTTNMDRPRRESLAEAIANIKTFRQLFVISHDDTFEKVTENVIFVEREV